MDNNLKNNIIAVFVSAILLLGWYFIDQKYFQPNIDNNTVKSYIDNKNNQRGYISNSPIKNGKNLNSFIEEKSSNKKVKIISPNLKGSISLKDLRFNDLVLNKYKEIPDSDTSPNVQLFSPSSQENGYYLTFGYLGEGAPDANSIWKSEKDEIKPGEEVSFLWSNKSGVKFVVTLSMDEKYMFYIKQSVINNSDKVKTLKFYGLINRDYNIEKEEKKLGNSSMTHTGFVGVFDKNLSEDTYKNIKKEKRKRFLGEKQIDWLGISDKYWLSAIIPANSANSSIDGNRTSLLKQDNIALENDNSNVIYNASYSYGVNNNRDKFQLDFISNKYSIAVGETIDLKHKFFAGPKEVKLLDFYEENENIKLFDRAIDFGWFYILTKPIFQTMSFLYKYVGNFGLVIMIFTVIVKLLMFSITNKSYKSMKKMKQIAPELEEIKARYKDDKMSLNKAVMDLYKREKVNPLSGCLPILIQIPVFFSIYKVLNVTIEMRGADFYGWIHDLSVSDPTNIFTLFGLLNFSIFPFFSIGAWPIIMAVTMFLQQKLQPAPADPNQAMVMQTMPLIFLFIFSSFPAGLLIYWSWNNVLSILQQLYVNKSSQ
ncbi:MAG TPA: membrane protein insertase YidC [Candidatus Megaira endosymbiont of Hartmannula sinica]|nr:membrane protein insertase YidC [Candidatus Megaera endosymbiont of Hartmannula sinica]